MIIQFIKKNIFFILLIGITTFLYGIVLFPSGSHSCFKNFCGLYFWGSHGHDGLWHLAIVEQAFQSFPFKMPTYSGATLAGYNIFYDVILFFLSKIGISSLIAYFKIIPILWFVLFTTLMIVFAKKLHNSKLFIFIFLFFNYFAGSFSYYFTLIKDKTLIGSSGFLAQLPQHMLLNMQFSLSLLLALIILIIMKNKIQSIKSILLLGLCVFISMGLKFYGGLISYVLVIIFLLLHIKKNSLKRTIFYLFVISIFFIASIFIFYNPFVSAKSGSIFVFSPFTFVHPITEDPSLFYLKSLTSARYTYASNNSIRLIPIELLNLVIFLLFYLGVRFLGLIYGLIISVQKKGEETIFYKSVYITIWISIMCTVLFIQKGEWTNIVQFLYYGIFLSTIYLSLFLYDVFQHSKKIGIYIIVLCMLFAIPSTLDIFRLYSQRPGTAYLPQGEYEALQELRKMPKGIVLSPLHDKNRDEIRRLREQNIPQPLYAWEDTAYVTAFSGKQSYIADIWMEQITGVDYKKRLKRVNKNDCSILKEIDYVYFNNEYKLNRNMFDCPHKLEMIYGNLTSSIYRVLK